MRKVFLDELPKWEKGEGSGNLGTINWSKSINYEVEFIYEDIKGKVKIIDYSPKDNLILIEYLGELYKIRTGSFSNCSLGILLRKINKHFVYDIDQTFKDEKRDITITDKEYRKDKNNQNKKYYKYTCNKCGWTEGWMVESNLKLGKGCPCCSVPIRKIVLGINTIWDTDKWMIELGVSEEDAKNHTKCSNKKIEVVCPDCGHKKKMTISNIYNRKSIGCSCGDGKSYPEKFIANMLKQIDVEFVTEYSPNWINPNRYDFYLPKYNIIIEAHGEQHYKRATGLFSRENQNKIDEYKRNIAVKNGILHYIEIDCSISSMNYIKDNILNTELNDIINLSKVYWEECDNFALSNLVKKACILYETYGIEEISKVCNVSTRTIQTYISEGKKRGWVKSKPRKKHKQRNSNSNANITKSKTVEVIKNGVVLDVFCSTMELERQSEEKFGVKLLNNKVSEVCTGKKVQYKGYEFRYKK